MASERLSDHDDSIASIERTINYINSHDSHDFINKILQYVTDEKGDLVDVLTDEYRTMAKKHKIIYDLDESYIKPRVYHRTMLSLYSDDFKCLDDTTNSYESQIFLYNVLQTFYSLLYPKNLNYFNQFVNNVVTYLKHSQDGIVCVFDGSHEILHDNFFRHVIVGCILAFSYFKAFLCRRLNSSIKGSGLKLHDERYKLLRKQYKKTCGFFSKIDTTTFQTLIRSKLGYETASKGGLKKPRKTNRRNRTRNSHKKRTKRRTVKRKK